MATFADRMTSLTDNLHASIQMRQDALKHVHEATVELTNRAQAFMSDVAEEHRTRAEDLRESLHASHEKRRQMSEDLRNHNQESLEEMRDNLNEMLTETRKTREDEVSHLFETFQHARDGLARDLREASHAWHAFAARRGGHSAPMTKPRPEPAHAHKASAAPPAPAKTRRPEPAVVAKPRSKTRRGKP